MKAKKRSTTDQNPNAWIVNPRDRGRKSIKKDKSVYLEDGQNFEIELFNPLSDSVLAEIKVNGKPVSKTGLIIRPGERFYLDCFVDDRKKFVFKTYMVEDTEETKESISKNGLVEIFFYKEETLQLNNWRDNFTTIVERRYYPYYYPWNPSPLNPYWYTYSTNTINNNLSTYTTTTNLSGLQSGLNSQNYNQGINNYNVQTSLSGNTSNAFYTCDSSTLGGSVDLSSMTYTSNSTPISSIETGRIEKGDKSNQKFEEIDMQFERYHISNVIYKLVPESQRPVETKEIVSEVKNFCEECGNKLKGHEKFCSECGNKL